MDTNWFKSRKRELRVTDQKLGEAIGRDRSIANRVINGDVPFAVRYVDGLARVLEVDREEILRRAGVLDAETDQGGAKSTLHMLESNARLATLGGKPLGRWAEDLPVYGTALGSAREIEGDAIEQTDLNRGDVTHYASRPGILTGKPDSYALHIQGGSMHPALPDGEMVAVSPKMPLSIGDNVVVYLRTDNAEDDDGNHARAVLVKELVRRTASYVELRQYQPAKDFRIPMADVLRIDRVLTRKEMLS